MMHQPVDQRDCYLWYLTHDYPDCLRLYERCAKLWDGACFHGDFAVYERIKTWFDAPTYYDVNVRPGTFIKETDHEQL